jgi:glutamate racemase
LKERYDCAARIITAEGRGFVGLVEDGREGTPQALEMVRAAIEPMIAAGADRIVLGCTHYPFLANRMREVIGTRKVEIIDPAPAIVRRVEWLLDELNLHAPACDAPHYDFLTAADEGYLMKLRRKAALECGG